MRELNELIEKYKKNLFLYSKGGVKPEFYLSRTGQFQHENKQKCSGDKGLVLCYTCGGKRLIRKREKNKPPEKCPTCMGYGFLVTDWVSAVFYPGAKMSKRKKKGEMNEMSNL